MFWPVFIYVTIGVCTFFASIENNDEGWLAFARAVIWPILMMLYLLKYGFYAIREVWAD